MEANPEEIKSIAEDQEVPNEDDAVDRYGNRHLDEEWRRQPKKRTQDDGGSRQKLTAACRRLTCCAVPAWRKGDSHKGSTVEKRRWKDQEYNNCIRN
jgi:hypothetical protein